MITNEGQFSQGTATTAAATAAPPSDTHSIEGAWDQLAWVTHLPLKERRWGT